MSKDDFLARKSKDTKMPTIKYTSSKDKNKKNNYNDTKNNTSTSSKNITESHIFHNHQKTDINDKNSAEKFAKCPLCDFSCLFASQMIQHTFKNHASKNLQTTKKITLSTNTTTPVKRKGETNYTNGGKKSKIENSSMAISMTNSVDSSKTETKIKSESSTSVVYACKECEYFNTNKKNYERHMWCHTSNFPFKCKHCSFSSNAENAVQRHITVYHTAIKKENLMNALKAHINTKTTKPSIKDENSSNESDLPSLEDKINKKESKSSSDLLKCIIIKTRNKDNITKWACHSCDVSSSSAASMDQHTTSVHYTPLKDCVTIIQDYFIINGSETKETEERVEGTVCVHCGFKAVDMNAMKIHLKEECQRTSSTKDDESGDDSEPRSLTIDLEKLDGKSKGSQGKFSRNLNEMMKQFTSYYRSSTKKFYLVCFMCKYKTFSMKVLKKHLVKEHANIINNHKQLTSLSRKCLFYSLKHECKLINKALLLKNSQLADKEKKEEKTDSKGSNDLAGQDPVAKEQDLKSPEEYKKEILETFEQEGELNKVFECSVCGKKVFFKCNLKKHVDSTHPKAKIIQLSLADGSLSHDDLLKFHKKHRVNKLKKLISKKGISKNELIALNSLISKELGGQALELVKDRSEVNDDEKVGMIDNLRLKRFQCGVCLFRSNFRSDISRHLKVKHPNQKSVYYSVLSIQDAANSLELYNQSRPKIDMRYTKQRKNPITLLPSKSITTTEEEPSSSVKESDSNEKFLKQENDFSEPNVPFVQLPTMPVTNSYEARLFYQSLPYSIRRSNPFEDFLKCEICPFYTFKATSFKVHNSCHQLINRAGMLSCPHCPFFVSTKRLYEKHLQLHSQFNFSQLARMSSHASKSSHNRLHCNAFFYDNQSHFNSNYINNYVLYAHQNYKSAHLRFCEHKYICPECPFKANRREDFWSHGKFHIEGKGRSAEFKCEQCNFFASDKRGLIQHSTLHNKGFTPKSKLNRADLVKREFCRCDLAEFLKKPDLACYKQLSCIYCSYSNNSVNLLRQHIASHVPLTNSYTTEIFSTQLDCADDLLNVICTRFLKMDDPLVEEVAKKVEDNDNNEMPVLEKFTDLPLSGLYNPNSTTSFKQSFSKPPIKVINLYNNSIKHMNDSKAPKIIKIASQISSSLTPSLLPKLTHSSSSCMLSPSMPLLKATSPLMEVKENKEESDSLAIFESIVESVEAIMHSRFLSAPEEVVCEREDCANEAEEDYLPEKDNQFDDVVWKVQCSVAKRVYMRSLGLAEIAHN